MAELTCPDTVKSHRRTRSRRLIESNKSAAILGTAVRPTRSTVSRHSRNYLYDIEVVKEEQYRAKIHYIGYSSEYDEWIQKSEITYMYKPISSPEPHQELSLFSVLACCIKQKLVPSRKSEDPAVRIQIPFDTLV